MIFIQISKSKTLLTFSESWQSENFRKTPKRLEIYATMAKIFIFCPEIMRCLQLLISKNLIQIYHTLTQIPTSFY